MLSTRKILGGILMIKTLVKKFAMVTLVLAITVDATVQAQSSKNSQSVEVYRDIGVKAYN